MPTKKIEVTKNPIKQILFSIPMPKNVIFTHFQFFWSATDILVSEMVVSKNAGMFGALLNTPIYVREADLEP